MSLFKILKGASSRISKDVTPIHDGWCYFTDDDGKFYIDSVRDGVGKRTCINPNSVSVTATLTQAGWNNKQQSIAIDGLKENQNGMIDVSPEITNEQMEVARNAILRVSGQSNGSLTITAYGEVPNCDIPVVIVLLN